MLLGTSPDLNTISVPSSYSKLNINFSFPSKPDLCRAGNQASGTVHPGTLQQWRLQWLGSRKHLVKSLFLVSKCQFEHPVEEYQCPVKATSENPLKHLFRSAKWWRAEGDTANSKQSKRLKVPLQLSVTSICNCWYQSPLEISCRAAQATFLVAVTIASLVCFLCPPPHSLRYL